ncbi:MAG: hypothetical protein JRJ60_11115 [Deltaproteobacteria bacterium]|nr:hypothetical protein [Deltaproteobacteria bacterium]
MYYVDPRDQQSDLNFVCVYDGVNSAWKSPAGGRVTLTFDAFSRMCLGKRILGYARNILQPGRKLTLGETDAYVPRLEQFGGQRNVFFTVFLK